MNLKQIKHKQNTQHLYDNQPIIAEHVEETIIALEKLESSFDLVKNIYMPELTNQFKLRPTNCTEINSDLINLVRLFLTLEAEYAWLYSDTTKEIKSSSTNNELIGTAHTIYLFRSKTNPYSGIEIFKYPEFKKFLSSSNVESYKQLKQRFDIVNNQVQTSYIACFKLFNIVLSNNQDKMNYRVVRHDKESQIYYCKEAYGNQKFLHCSKLTLSKSSLEEIVFLKLKVTDKSAMYNQFVKKNSKSDLDGNNSKFKTVIKSNESNISHKQNSISLSESYHNNENIVNGINKKFAHEGNTSSVNKEENIEQPLLNNCIKESRSKKIQEGIIDKNSNYNSVKKLPESSFLKDDDIDKISEKLMDFRVTQSSYSNNNNSVLNLQLQNNDEMDMNSNESNVNENINITNNKKRKKRKNSNDLKDFIVDDDYVDDEMTNINQNKKVKTTKLLNSKVMDDFNNLGIKFVNYPLALNKNCTTHDCNIKTINELDENGFDKADINVLITNYVSTEFFIESIKLCNTAYFNKIILKYFMDNFDNINFQNFGVSKYIYQMACEIVTLFDKQIDEMYEVLILKINLPKFQDLNESSYQTQNIDYKFSSDNSGLLNFANKIVNSPVTMKYNISRRILHQIFSIINILKLTLEKFSYDIDGSNNVKIDKNLLEDRKNQLCNELKTEVEYDLVNFFYDRIFAKQLTVKAEEISKLCILHHALKQKVINNTKLNLSDYKNLIIKKLPFFNEKELGSLLSVLEDVNYSVQAKNISKSLLEGNTTATETIKTVDEIKFKEEENKTRTLIKATTALVKRKLKLDEALLVSNLIAIIKNPNNDKTKFIESLQNSNILPHTYDTSNTQNNNNITDITTNVDNILLNSESDSTSTNINASKLLTIHDNSSANIDSSLKRDSNSNKLKKILLVSNSTDIDLSKEDDEEDNRNYVNYRVNKLNNENIENDLIIGEYIHNHQYDRENYVQRFNNDSDNFQLKLHIENIWEVQEKLALEYIPHNHNIKQLISCQVTYLYYWSLYPRNWISTHLLDYYVILLQRRSIAMQINKVNIESCKFMPVYFIGCVYQDEKFIFKTCGMTRADLSSKYIFFPIYHSNHYFLFKYDVCKEQLIYHDSIFDRERFSKFGSIIQQYLKEIYSRHDMIIDVRLTSLFTPQQDNGYDCGVFCMALMDILSDDIELTNLKQEHIKLWRNKIKADIIRGIHLDMTHHKSREEWYAETFRHTYIDSVNHFNNIDNLSEKDFDNHYKNLSIKQDAIAVDIHWLKIRKFDGNFDTVSIASTDTNSFEDYVDLDVLKNNSLDYDYKVKSNFKIAYTDDIQVIMRLHEDTNKRECLKSLKFGEILIKLMNNSDLFSYKYIQTAGLWYWIKLIRFALFVAINNYKYEQNLNYNITQINRKKQCVVRTFDKLITTFLFEFYKIQHEKDSIYANDILENFNQHKSREGSIIFKDIIASIINHMKTVGSGANSNQLKQDVEKIEILLKNRKSGTYYFSIKAYDNIDDMYDKNENDKYILSKENCQINNDNNNDTENNNDHTSHQLQDCDYVKIVADEDGLVADSLVKHKIKKRKVYNYKKEILPAKKNRVDIVDQVKKTISYNLPENLKEIFNSQLETNKIKLSNYSKRNSNVDDDIDDIEICDNIDEEYEQWKNDLLNRKRNNLDSRLAIMESGNHNINSNNLSIFDEINEEYDHDPLKKCLTNQLHYKNNLERPENTVDKSEKSSNLSVDNYTPTNRNSSILSCGQSSSSFTTIENCILSSSNSSTDYSINIENSTITTSTSRLQLIRSHLSDIVNIQQKNKSSILTIIDSINQQLKALESLMSDEI